MGLIVSVGEASKQYPEMHLATLQEAFAMQNEAGSGKCVAHHRRWSAVNTSGTPREVKMTAYVKGLILPIHLEGPTARMKKDQAIALLKTAAARL